MYTTQLKSSWERKVPLFPTLGQSCLAQQRAESISAGHCYASTEHYQTAQKLPCGGPYLHEGGRVPTRGRLCTCKGDCTTVCQTLRQHNTPLAVSILLQPAWCSVVAQTLPKQQAELEAAVLSYKVKKRS